ncbi:DNA primase [Alteribacillus sp. JSM 102045]|uniref:DNA primase n=1 Tax=Alteribacillus sp. JSM 102045 TaxID=1562101 RepID=UPI0035C1229D
MNKKLLYSVLAGILAVSVLAACGGMEEEDPAMEDDTGGEEDVEIEDDAENGEGMEEEQDQGMEEEEEEE